MPPNYVINRRLVPRSDATRACSSPPRDRRSARARNPRTRSLPHCAVFLAMFFFLLVAVCTLAHVGHRSPGQRVSAWRTYFLIRILLRTVDPGERSERSGAYNWVQFSGPVVSLHLVSEGRMQRRATEKKPEPRIIQLLRAQGPVIERPKTSLLSLCPIFLAAGRRMIANLESDTPFAIAPLILGGSYRKLLRCC